MPDLPYLSYLLPASLSAASLEDRLASRLSIHAEASGDVSRLYLDTVDWRLHQAGGVLQAKRTDRVLALIWEDRRNGKAMASCRVDHVPRRPAELPAGWLREQIAPVVDGQVLLPLLRTHSRPRLLRVLDTDRNTLARLRLETAHCEDGEGRPVGAPAPRLTLVPVRGHETAARQLIAMLAEEFGLVAGAPTRFDEALALVGRVPGDNSSKPDRALEP